MTRKQTLRDAAAETTHTAAERGTAAYEAAKDKIAPLAKDIRHRSADYASSAREALEPRLDEALERMQPLLEDAKHYVDDAVHKVAPAYEAARDKLEHDVLPRIVDALEEAAQSPVAQETQKRSVAALAALKGELALPEPTAKKGGAGKKVVKVALIGGVIAGIVVAVRKFLGSKDDSWTAHEPTRAYTNPEPSEYRAAASDALAEEEMVAEGAPVADPETVPAAEAPVDETLADGTADDTLDAAGYGEGSYVGENPPEGFTIKGNERSKKFHTSESGGYGRTIADVWFNSTEAAEAAGFTRAQR